MPVNIPRLRWWFAALAIALIVVVAGFYGYARYRLRSAVRQIPQKIGINVQQSTTGFTFSKSEGGRTIFTVHASQAVQYKGEGRAELKDVNIIVYGREANRYDQIYGSNFEYDPQAGTIAAKGEVHIDLEGNAEGPINPDQATPQELKNPIHLKTSGLVFNRNTGVAETKERLEFRVPQASGSAMGATYDSRGATLTLASNIQVHSNAPHEADIKAAHGVITKGPNRAVLDSASIERPNGSFQSRQLTIYFRDDNTVERLLADGDVKSHESGKTTVDASAPRAEAVLGEKNDLRTASMTGGVSLVTSGNDNIQANAGKLLFTFAARNMVDTVRATDGVRLLQQPAKADSGRPVEITTDAMDFVIRNGRVLAEAVTSGAAEITAFPSANATGDRAGKTVLTAGQFRALFQKNRLTGLNGTPNAKIVMSTPGKPDKVSTSDRVTVKFAPSGGIDSLVQEGDFHYLEDTKEGRREAWAGNATYNAGQGPSDVLKLSGSPRFVEGSMTTTADAMEIGRISGDAFASGNVKTTYSEVKPQPGGALLATADPIHVTGTSMTARRSSGTARYLNARLWQGPNIIEAPTLDFRREPREVLATGDRAKGVTTLFVAQDKNGKSTPINVTAERLTYADAQRQAHFEGGVTMKGADTTVTADKLDIFLHPRVTPATSGGRADAGGPSQLDRAVASSNVTIQQPNRRATGETLVYSAAEGKFVLTGGPPSIFDAERGKITGDSLTFFQRDDRVLVESKNSPTITRTRVAK